MFQLFCYCCQLIIVYIIITNRKFMSIQSIQPIKSIAHPITQGLIITFQEFSKTSKCSSLFLIHNNYIFNNILITLFILRIILFSFSMKKSPTTLTISMPVLTPKGVNSPQSHRKVQGFDKITTAQSFASKIQKIKKKPKKESLQDEYVKGLQDEIHYLELQLKLLKEKQIAKHSQVDQLQTFFGDGIAINQNILSLKNGFNNYKNLAQKKIASLTNEKKQRESIIQSMSAKVSDISKQIYKYQKCYKQLLTSRSDITHEKIKKQTTLKHMIEMQDETLRSLKAQNKRMNQNITGLQRAKELASIGMLRVQANKFTRLNKLRQSVRQKQKQFEELGKKYQQLKKQDDQQSYVIVMKQDNKKLRKKQISMESQLAELNRKVKQKQMQLQDKLQQRHKQILGRMQMQQRLDDVKQSIDRQNNLSVQQLQKIAIEKVAKILQKLVDKNRRLTKYVQYYSNLLSKVDESVYQFNEKKPDLKNKLIFTQNQIKKLQKQLQVEKKAKYQLSSQLAKLKSKTDHIEKFTPMIQQDIKKYQEKIKAGQAQRQNIKKQIKPKEKQLELLEILKGLNLQETQISSSSNASIQDRLIDFMHSWENLHHES